ncbi:Zinc finger protein [Datura stramonium]|uniref:Zinc finger protein n=1 Tax=Datura stramonium TaxID=4076 RepID=A0ABS8TJ86_DATST|nr:Zinc finger protein [Datura stramonium]
MQQNLVASHHKRVGCEACERAPAAFLCKVDYCCFVPPAMLASILQPLGPSSPTCPNYSHSRRYGPPTVDTVGGDSMMIGGPTGEDMEDDGFLSLTQDADDTTIDEETKMKQLP